MNRILVLRGGAIGDFVLTLPAIKLLRDAHPDARLEIIGYPHIAALAEKRFYADAVRSLESGALARFFVEDAELPPDLVSFFGSFDLIVSYLFDPDRIFAQNLSGGRAQTFLHCSPEINEDEHAVWQLARPLESLGLFLGEHVARLFPTSEDSAFARHLVPGDSTIAVHPGSGSAQKNWPLENWMELIDQLLWEHGKTSVLIIGGEADEEQLSKLRSAFPVGMHFVQQIPLVHLAAVLERCQVFIGHDSGISHIAGAVGARSLLLFGPSNPEVWAPANSSVQIVKSPTKRMADISVATVAAAANAILASRN